MKEKIAIIGAGNVGLGLAHAFSLNGFNVKLGSRNPKLTHNKLNEVEICSISDAVSDSDLNLLTVPDSAISSVCESLSSQFKKGSLVLHCSGAISSQALLSAQVKDCLIASAHPLNTFPNSEAAIQLFNQPSHSTHLYCEGDSSALKKINTIFSDIGFKPIEITAQAKPLYHAACVFACNYLTVLMDISLQTADAADLDRDVFWNSIQPLIQSTLNNISAHGTVNSLSGPIARADTQTVKNHIQKLNSISNEVANTYIDMAIHAVKLALRNNEIDDKKITELTELAKLISNKS